MQVVVKALGKLGKQGDTKIIKALLPLLSLPIPNSEASVNDSDIQHVLVEKIEVIKTAINVLGNIGNSGDSEIIQALLPLSSFSTPEMQLYPHVNKYFMNLVDATIQEELHLLFGEFYPFYLRSLEIPLIRVMINMRAVADSAQFLTLCFFRKDWSHFLPMFVSPAIYI